MQYRPGNTSNSTTGKRRLVYPGWRRFITTDPLVSHEDPYNHLDSTADTAGTSVPHGYTTFSLTQVATGKTSGAEMGSYLIPLTNQFGERVKFTDAFCLLTMVETIAVTEDFGDTDQHQPAWGFGISSLAADIGEKDGASNDVLQSGLHRYKTGGGADRYGTYSSSDATAGSATENTAYPLVITEWVIGPGAGSTNPELDTNYTMSNSYDVASQGYTKSAAPDGLFKSQTTDAATFQQSDGQVYIYAFCGTIASSTDSHTAATVTCRLWYTCVSDPSGYARFTGT